MTCLPRRASWWTMDFVIGIRGCDLLFWTNWWVYDKGEEDRGDGDQVRWVQKAELRPVCIIDNRP
jgi:hypothetical protein